MSWHTEARSKTFASIENPSICMHPLVISNQTCPNSYTGSIGKSAYLVKNISMAIVELHGGNGQLHLHHNICTYLLLSNYKGPWNVIRYSCYSSYYMFTMSLQVYSHAIFASLKVQYPSTLFQDSHDDLPMHQYPNLKQQVYYVCEAIYGKLDSDNLSPGQGR